jgi:hypothetical protein
MLGSTPTIRRARGKILTCAACCLAACSGTEGDRPPTATDLLVDRVWTQTGGDRPGVMRIFLSDGTLVQDSCWETHRLSRWRAEEGGMLRWEEDGIQIRAEVAALDDAALVLRIQLLGGAVETERYTKAAVPYVCPDMPR